MEVGVVGVKLKLTWSVLYDHNRTGGLGGNGEDELNSDHDDN